VTRATIRLAALVLALIVAWAASLMVGAVRVAPGQVMASAFGGGSDLPTSIQKVLWEIRAPRAALAVVVGAGLGCAGAAFQGLFRNPLADPFVIGASSGAALGATIAIAFGWSMTWGYLDATAAAALAGALGVVAVVYAIASVGRETPTIALLLAGIAVSSFVGAVVSLIMFVQNQQLAAIFGWLMGSLSARGWHAFWGTSPWIVVSCAALWLLARPLDCLAFGEETAASLGFHLNHVRGAVVLGASLATAAAVAAGGIIGFVGLIAPHAARFLMGTSRHAVVIPASGLTGGLLLVLADDVVRSFLPQGELPVGVVTALLGGPFFLYLMRMRPRQLERRA